MAINYFSSKNGTLGTRLDHAWTDYRNDKLSFDDRKNALEFLIYVFDIPLTVATNEQSINEQSINEQSINELLITLMNARAVHKNNGNENYIPMLASGSYKFNTNAETLEPTIFSKSTPNQRIQEKFDKNQLLDVNDDDKDVDINAENKPYYLDSKQRAKYNIEISDKLFRKKGNPFDSSNSIAHKKKGYVAFTLNTNGELSVFEHLGAVIR